MLPANSKFLPPVGMTKGRTSFSRLVALLLQLPRGHDEAGATVPFDISFGGYPPFAKYAKHWARSTVALPGSIKSRAIHAQDFGKSTRVSKLLV
jgi:hypothetical protein